MSDAGVPQIDIDRLIGELKHLATISDCAEPPPAVTRVVFTETDLRAREYLLSLYENAGLSVRVDPIGNTFARWEGKSSEQSAVGTGSHTDAIPHAGMYDGTVGVLGGLEAIRSLQRMGYVPNRPIELVMFTSEEPTRFGVGCSGSRAMSGAMTPQELLKLVDSENRNYDQVRRDAGFQGDLDDVLLAKWYFHAFVELHIEQGPELEATNVPVGIVTAIAAPATVNFVVTGEGGHAGAVLMPKRHDALSAAVEMIASIESLALQSASPDLVATVGKIDVHPGAVNSIPSRVEFSLDLRDIDGENRNRVLDAITQSTQDIATRRGVKLSPTMLNCDPPALADSIVLAAIENSARTLGVSTCQMISRAYHDSLFMARIAPTGMIFIPCRGGVSHRPDEYASPQHIATGVQTLAMTLAELAA